MILKFMDQHATCYAKWGDIEVIREGRQTRVSATHCHGDITDPQCHTMVMEQKLLIFNLLYLSVYFLHTTYMPIKTIYIL